MTDKRKRTMYSAPRAVAVAIGVGGRVLAASETDATFSGAQLNNGFTNSGSDAWSGTQTTPSGSNLGGGWTNSGDNPWE